MREAEHSRTAVLVAALRARGPCDDPWAEALSGADGAELVEQMLVHHPDVATWIGVRTTFIDQRLLRHPRPQVVVLGAGLDSRAARLDLLGTRFFEVDAPASLAERARRTARVEGYPTSAAVQVPCDFEKEDFLDRLRDAGYRHDEPAFFVWEGVAYYLPEPAVRSTLERVLSGHRDSLVLFDMLPERMVAASQDPANHHRFGVLLEAGEPLRFGLDDPLPYLYELGFRFVQTTRFDEACLNVTGTYDPARAFRYQTLTLAGRTPP